MLSSLSLSVLRACNVFFASFSDSFKYFHTADTFAALVHKSIWSRHVIVQYKLFGLFTYSAEHRKSFFCYFRPNNFGCRTFGASLLPSLQSATPIQTERSDEGVKNRTENSLLLLNFLFFFDSIFFFLWLTVFFFFTHNNITSLWCFFM